MKDTVISETEGKIHSFKEIKHNIKCEFVKIFVRARPIYLAV